MHIYVCMRILTYDVGYMTNMNQWYDIGACWKYCISPWGTFNWGMNDPPLCMYRFSNIYRIFELGKWESNCVPAAIVFECFWIVSHGQDGPSGGWWGWWIATKWLKEIQNKTKPLVEAGWSSLIESNSIHSRVKKRLLNDLLTTWCLE